MKIVNATESDILELYRLQLLTFESEARWLAVEWFLHWWSRKRSLKLLSPNGIPITGRWCGKNHRRYSLSIWRWSGRGRSLDGASRLSATRAGSGIISFRRWTMQSRSARIIYMYESWINISYIQKWGIKPLEKYRMTRIILCIYGEAIIQTAWEVLMCLII